MQDFVLSLSVFQVNKINGVLVISKRNARLAKKSIFKINTSLLDW